MKTKTKRLILLLLYYLMLNVTMGISLFQPWAPKDHVGRPELWFIIMFLISFNVVILLILLFGPQKWEKSDE